MRKAPLTANAKLRGDPGFVDFLIEDSPFYLIARTAGRYSIDLENALRAIGMDLPSWRALMVVAESNPSSVSEIADRAVMRLSTMTRVIQRLEKRDLMALARREGDARVTEVYITPAGKHAVSQIRQIASRLYNIAFHDLDAEEIATLNGILSRVFGNLSLRPESFGQARPVSAAGTKKTKP